MEEKGLKRNEGGRGYFKEAIFVGCIAFFGALGGFAMTVSRVKRRNPNSFMKGVQPHPETEQMESGSSLGLRALAWGSVFAVTGVGTLTFVVCKLMGVHSVEESKVKFQSVAPAIKRNEDAEEAEATMAQLRSSIFGAEKDG